MSMMNEAGSVETQEFKDGVREGIRRCRNMMGLPADKDLEECLQNETGMPCVDYKSLVTKLKEQEEKIEKHQNNKDQLLEVLKFGLESAIEYDVLKKQRDEIEKEMNIVEARNAKLCEEIKHLKQQSTEYIQKVQREKQEIIRNKKYYYSRNIERKDSEIRRLRESVKRLEMQCTEHRKTYKENEVELNRIGSLLENTQAENKTALSQIRELKRVNNEQNARIDEIKQRMFEEGKEEGYQTGLSQSKEEIQRLKSTILEKDSAAVELKANLAESEKDLKDLKAAYYECQQALDYTHQLLQSRAHDVDSMDELKLEISAGKREIEELQHKLMVKQCSFDKERLEFKDKTRQLMKEIHSLQRGNNREQVSIQEKEWHHSLDERYCILVFMIFCIEYSKVNSDTRQHNSRS